MNPMTVADLIAFLQAQPQDLPVVYQCYSEYALLEPEHMGVAELQHHRVDGWVHDRRPDAPSRQYFVFPGN